MVFFKAEDVDFDSDDGLLEFALGEGKFVEVNCFYFLVFFELFGDVDVLVDI